MDHLEVFKNLFVQTGLYQFFTEPAIEGGIMPLGVGQAVMMVVCLLLAYLGIKKNFEPLLLVPIAVGGFLANVPGADLTLPGGFLHTLYQFGVTSTLFPLLIFVGVGAMTDFGPLLANPKTALLGGAAQFAIFGTLLGGVLLSEYVPFFNLTLKQVSAISIIGGADGPTSIYIAGKLAPELLGAIAVAAYSYIALVPMIQPPIMRALTTPSERKIRMKQLRTVSKTEKILFPFLMIILTALFIPQAIALLGALMFGNLLKESGVTDRLAKTASNELINVCTILLGLAVGSKMSAEMFLVTDTLFILALGAAAFCLGTAAGILMAKLMNVFSEHKINPLIGSAGVSAMPMAARVSEKLGVEADPDNHLAMHAMGGNVAGTIGSGLAAGILLALFM